jgi:hypothetical protein
VAKNATTKDESLRAKKIFMGKHCLISFLLALLAVGWAVSFIPGSAHGQSSQEPRLEGVSYHEMAEWQSRYGGGFWGIGFPGPGCCGYGSVVPVAPPEMQAPSKGKKRTVRKSGKQRPTR